MQETVISPSGYVTYRIQLYNKLILILIGWETFDKNQFHPLVYLFCTLIRSGLEQMTLLLSKVNRGAELKKQIRGVCSILIDLFFIFKMSHNIYHMSSPATLPEYLLLGDTKAFGIGWHSASRLSSHRGGKYSGISPSNPLYIHHMAFI